MSNYFHTKAEEYINGLVGHVVLVKTCLGCAAKDVSRITKKEAYKLNGERIGSFLFTKHTCDKCAKEQQEAAFPLIDGH